MQTYTETLEKKPFNWKTSLLSRIRHNSPISKELTRKATCWTTCPCGNLNPILLDNNVPKNIELILLGSDFCYEIDMGQWEQALKILREIENKAQELIQEIS